MPGLHEGLFHPLPQLVATPQASDPDVTFVHIRQYQRICKRRRAIAAGDVLGRWAVIELTAQHLAMIAGAGAWVCMGRLHSGLSEGE